MNYQDICDFLEANYYRRLLHYSKQQLASLFGKEFAEMKGYDQNNPHHCYDLLEHTIVTLCSLDLSALSEKDVTALRIAALYHDIGKPNVAFEKNGRTVYYNHEKESSKMAKGILDEIVFDKRELGKICFLIENHGAFISYKLESEINNGISNQFIKPITKSAINNEISKIKTTCLQEGLFVPSLHEIRLLLRLCTADAKAQSKTVIQNGVVIDSREKKLERIKAIARIIMELETA